MASEISTSAPKPCVTYATHLKVGCERSPIVFNDKRAIDQFNTGAALCESPIEYYLLAALQDQSYGNPNFEFIIETNLQSALSRIGKREVICVPQAQWAEGGFIFDFVIFDMRASIKSNIKALVIECDGHEYHERTKEQAAYDRFRDRFAVYTGFSVFRFTGSEINHDSYACADQIIGYVLRGIA